MVWSIVADGIFACAVLIETLAALSMARLFFQIAPREELDPILAFFHDRILPVLTLPADLIPGTLPPWFADAYAIGVALFFLFFIAQARKAAAPHEVLEELDASPPRLSPLETVLDAAIPAIFCGLGAILFSLTLLPLLTPLAALWLLARKLTGKPSWFEVSRSYYVNLLLVLGLTVLLLCLPR